MTAQEYFKNFNFDDEQIQKYIAAAEKDIEIARKTNIKEVKFQFSYNALIKCAYAIIGYKEKKRIRSIRGHHVKLIEKMSELLNDKDIFINGNSMRSKRNKDLYFADSLITEKEAADYLSFVNDLIRRIKKEIQNF